jgi:hypothetical protein
MKYLVQLLCLLALLESPCILSATSAYDIKGRTDTCTVNDVCATALDLLVFTDLGFTCVTGCNNLATPEMIDNACGIGQSPTVWYRVQTDNDAITMNIQVQSDDLQSPTISLFVAVPDCDQLQPISLTADNLPCFQGNDGLAKAIGTVVSGNQIYYMAISDPHAEGTFELCVNTLSTSGSDCVTSRNIEITARSSGGPLEGPFYPGETISICFNVNSYTAAGNGCQWFQGLIPVFGNGWDPSSFPGDGQPLNPTINENPMGVQGNGVYGTATWDWFSDVDYHFDNSYLQPGDFDGNGTYDLCDTHYDPNCPDVGGLAASCCAPCWGAPLGTILPNGWFAYGINGTCPTPGPPIRVDWGDGNSCSNVMGPWKFCFDLVTREFPHCDEDSTTMDLSLGFITMTDGETGSWTGSTPFCYDQPAYLKPAFNCLTEIDLGTVTLPVQCSGNLVTYTLFEPDVSYWEWTVSPSAYVLDTIFEGVNGHVLESHPNYTGSSSAIITYNLVGHTVIPGTIFLKKLIFEVLPPIQFQVPEVIEICEHKPGTVTITPGLITGGQPPYSYLWNPSGDTLQTLVLHAPFHAGFIDLTVYDSIGCVTNDSIEIKLKSCDFAEMYEDEINDTINPQPQRPHDGNFTYPDVKSYNRSTEEIDNTSPFQIHPTPTSGNATLVWTIELHQDAIVEIFNTQGFRLMKLPVYTSEGYRKQIDTQSLAPGVYLVSFSNEEFRYVGRLVRI